MTDARTSQAAALALVEFDASARVTQGAALVLYQEVPLIDARLTQAVALALTEFTLEARFTQGAALVLADYVPCVTYWIKCVKVTRTDGTVFAYTDHDSNVVFAGTTYKSCKSLAPSAFEMSAYLGAVGNQELLGILTDNDITEADLYNGAFDGATIEVWVVPWSNTSGETPYRAMAGVMGDVSQGLSSFSAEVVTPGIQIQQQALLHTYTPTCRFRLGDSRCTVDVEALRVSGTVTSVARKSAHDAAHRRKFYDNVRAEADNYFAYGSIEWTTGSNAGTISEVKSFTQSTGEFVLWKPMAYAIEVGDQYEALPGCDLRKTTCINTFDNYINFGGYPDVPGRDRLIKTPNSK